MRKVDREKKSLRIEYAKGAAETFFFLFLFYRWSWIMVAAGIPFLLLELRRRKRDWTEAYRWRLNLEFRDGLHGIAAALEAGYSMENAIGEAQRDLKVLYGEDSLLLPRLQKMEQGLAWNQSIEMVWEELGKESQVEDIRSFAEVLRTAGRTGGNLIGITRTAAQRIGERIEVRREIKAVTAGKQMEGRLMAIVPLGMIVYFWITSPGFLDFYYETGIGRGYMTLFLFLYLGAREWSRQICNITV